MALKKIDTIVLKRKTGKDTFAKDTFGAEETFEGRWNEEVKEFVDTNGAQLVSVSTVYYEPPTEVALGDLVKLQGTNTFYPIRAIAKHRNGSGTKELDIAYLTANVR